MEGITLKKFESKTVFAATFHTNIDSEVHTVFFKDEKRKQAWWGKILQNNNAFLKGESTVYYTYEIYEVLMPYRLTESMRFDFGMNL